jgi:hypothetical protein
MDGDIRYADRTSGDIHGYSAIQQSVVEEIEVVK